jgi:hypothetical protein
MMSLWEFSPRRVAYIIAVMICCFVPLHGQLPCEGSGILTAASGILMLIVGVLCLISPDEAKYRPFMIALIGFVLNTTFTH